MTPLPRRRAQLSVEFVVVLVLVLFLVASVGLLALREMEFNAALGAARLAAADYARAHPPLFVTSIGWTMNDRNIAISPRVYNESARVTSNDALAHAVLQRVAFTLSANATLDSTQTNFTAIYYTYSVDLSR